MPSIPLPDQPYPAPTPGDPNPAPARPPQPGETPPDEPLGIPPSTPDGAPPPSPPVGVPPAVPPEIPVTPTTPNPQARSAAMADRDYRRRPAPNARVAAQPGAASARDAVVL